MANSVRTKNIVIEKCKLKSLEFLPSTQHTRGTHAQMDLKRETNSKIFKTLIHYTMEAKYFEFTKKGGNSLCPDCQKHCKTFSVSAVQNLKAQKMYLY